MDSFMILQSSSESEGRYYQCAMASIYDVKIMCRSLYDNFVIGSANVVNVML